MMYYKGMRSGMLLIAGWHHEQNTVSYRCQSTSRSGFSSFLLTALSTLLVQRVEYHRASFAAQYASPAS